MEAVGGGGAAGRSAVLPRLAYLGVTTTFAMPFTCADDVFGTDRAAGFVPSYSMMCAKVSWSWPRLLIASLR